MKKITFLFLSVLIFTPTFILPKSKILLKKSAKKIKYNKNLNFAQVIYVKAKQIKQNNYYFSVTVKHKDEGWKHYADAWQVVHPKTKKVIATRVLAHPHDDEQPFTKSMDVKIPKNLKKVLVRAKCTKHGYDGKTVLVNFFKKKGKYYQIISSKR